MERSILPIPAWAAGGAFSRRTHDEDTRVGPVWANSFSSHDSLDFHRESCLLCYTSLWLGPDVLGRRVFSPKGQPGSLLHEWQAKSRLDQSDAESCSPMWSSLDRGRYGCLYYEKSRCIHGQPYVKSESSTARYWTCLRRRKTRVWDSWAWRHVQAWRWDQKGRCLFCFHNCIISWTIVLAFTCQARVM